MMQSKSFEIIRRWSAMSLLNLLLVSILGILLRYKAAFPLPAINYNFLLLAHSHFAFSGWLSTAIFTSFVYILSQGNYPIRKAYIFQFWLAQTASFGMLLSFTLEGYGLLSIFFSVLFIVFSWWFTWRYWQDAGKSDLPLLVKILVKAALFFFVLSGAGPFLLSYILSSRLGPSDLYYNSVYLFLHFQYNGWFSFGILALFFYTAHHDQLRLDGNKGLLFSRLMVAACIPAYCLSLLWMNPPVWVFVISAVAACMQLVALVIFCVLVKDSFGQWSHLLPFQAKLFWGLSFIAFVIKLVLQALSVIPALGRFVFGFRAVIIGYLHLVMLGFLSFFLIGFFIKENFFNPGPGIWKNGLAIFITGVLSNEVLLLLQGLSAMHGANLPFTPLLFLGAAGMILWGLALTFFTRQTNQSKI